MIMDKKYGKWSKRGKWLWQLICNSPLQWKKNCALGLLFVSLVRLLGKIFVLIIAKIYDTTGMVLAQSLWNKNLGDKLCIQNPPDNIQVIRSNFASAFQNKISFTSAQVFLDFVSFPFFSRLSVFFRTANIKTILHKYGKSKWSMIFLQFKGRSIFYPVSGRALTILVLELLLDANFSSNRLTLVWWSLPYGRIFRNKSWLANRYLFTHILRWYLLCWLTFVSRNSFPGVHIGCRSTEICYRAASYTEILVCCRLGILSIM